MNLVKSLSNRRLATATWSKTETTNKNYHNYIHLSNLQRVLLAAGSSIAAILNPLRADMVADLGETTGGIALDWMRSEMRKTGEGQRVLIERPRLNSSQIDYNQLAALPEWSFGHQYANFYQANGVSPDTRRPVQFVEDEELAYVMQRYRELHDIVHTLLDMSIDVPSEVAVKAFEAVQTRLPMCVLASLVGPLQMSLEEKRIFLTRHLPWALKTGRECKFLMAVHFESRFEQDIEDLRRELNIMKKPK